MLFLRTGWVVSQVGLVPTLGIVLLAHLITIATALSVSAIATNMQVGAGGAYFMISRSLGLEIGGAIGVPLFLAQTFSVTLYAYGLAESLRLFWPDVPMMPVAAATVLAVSLLAGKSAEVALKAQVPILIAIAVALGSLFIGAGQRLTESLPLWGGSDSGEGFWVVFAVFFPAVTGLMAGVSLSGDLENPTRSIVRGTLAAVGVALGGLNAVAPILTMFFLTTYGVVNLVAGLEQLAGSPSYRPSIQVPWFISLAGATGCVWVMMLINPLAAITAITVEAAIYLALRRALRRRELSASWGDLRYGALLSLTRSLLLRLRRLPVDPRNWRPHILVFTDDPRERVELLRFAAWLNQERGILTVSQLLIGDLESEAPQIIEETARTHCFLDEIGLVPFAETEVAPDLESGVLNICQANGFAGLASNTVMIEWSERPASQALHLRLVRRAALLGKSFLLCRIQPRRWGVKVARIDVWWGGLDNNGDMLLLFAHLISLNRDWAGAQVTVKTVASNAMTLAQTERSLTELVSRGRIRAATRTIERTGGEAIREIIHRESCDADLVFLGLRAADAGEEEGYAARLRELIGDLPTVILLRAAGPFVGRLL